METTWQYTRGVYGIAKFNIEYQRNLVNKMYETVLCLEGNTIWSMVSFHVIRYQLIIVSRVKAKQCHFSNILPNLKSYISRNLNSWSQNDDKCFFELK